MEIVHNVYLIHQKEVFFQVIILEVLVSTIVEQEKLLLGVVNVTIVLHIVLDVTQLALLNSALDVTLLGI
jgi:hypothetical protein